MEFHGVKVFTADILLVGKKLGMFYWVKDLILILWDLVRFRKPRLIDDFISSRIQRGTLSLWNHVELISPNYKTGVLECIGADLQGVRVADLEKEFPSDKYRICVLRPYSDIPFKTRERVIRYAFSKIGESYPFSTIWKIRWALIVGGLEKLNAMTKGEIKEMICSQLVDHAWKTEHDVLPGVADFPVPGSFYDSTKLKKVIVLI
jgi:hypothetical protein